MQEYRTVRGGFDEIPGVNEPVLTHHVAVLKAVCCNFFPLHRLAEVDNAEFLFGSTELSRSRKATNLIMLWHRKG